MQRPVCLKVTQAIKKLNNYELNYGSFSKIKKYQYICAEMSTVADQIRGMKVSRAVELLEFSSKKASGIVKKVLDSAIANAENNEGADIDELKVTKIFVDEGRTQKRFQPRAKGRACKILKRSSHLTVTVGDNR